MHALHACAPDPHECCASAVPTEWHTWLLLHVYITRGSCPTCTSQVALAQRSCASGGCSTELHCSFAGIRISFALVTTFSVCYLQLQFFGRPVLLPIFAPIPHVNHLNTASRRHSPFHSTAATHTHARIPTHTRTHARTHTRTHTRTHNTHAYTHAHARTHARTHAHTRDPAAIAPWKSGVGDGHR
jgi:hypothetical protein